MGEVNLRQKAHFLKVAAVCWYRGHVPYPRFGGVIACSRCGHYMGRWEQRKEAAE